MSHIFLMLSLALLSIVESTCRPAAAATVVTYAAPPDEKFSADYQVAVEGRQVDVYKARVLDPPFDTKGLDYGGTYSFASFDADGPVEVRIVSRRSLREVVIRPLYEDVRSRLESDNTLVLSLQQPRKISIEPEGKKGPLLLFSNPLDDAAPKAGTPGVIYFGPGIHKPGKIRVRSNETLYIAGGSVVKAGIEAWGDNITIRGRGILDGSDWGWKKGPASAALSIRGNNVTVSGITIRGSWGWTIVPRDSRGVTIRNVKICNSRFQNDDGINPSNSQDVLITDSFIRSDDDNVALKGIDFTAANPNVENITVEDSVLWSDRARIFLLGHESRAHFMRGITLRNLDIIHFAMTPFLFEPGEDMYLEDVVVRDVRIHGEGQRELIRLKPAVNLYMKNQAPGYIRNVRFENIEVAGRPGKYLVELYGADAKHDVKNVVFNNVVISGARFDENSDHLKMGDYVRDTQFNSGNPAQNKLVPAAPRP